MLDLPRWEWNLNHIICNCVNIAKKFNRKWNGVKMNLSLLLEKYQLVESYEIKNEKDFETLALVQSEIALDYCTFIDDERFITDISQYVKMILTTKAIADKISCVDVGLCIVDNPRNLYFKLHNSLADAPEYVRDKSDTKIGMNCQISELSSIAKNNVIIGNNVIIEEFVVIRENTIIGDNCIIRAGVKLGSVDYEFKREEDRIFGVEHYGGIVIENDVEIQCNSVINRGLYPWDDTRIGAFTKIDACVFISHGVKIGKCNMIVGQTLIGGRTVIGDNCWLGMDTSIKNGIVIGNNARLNMGAVVTMNVSANESVTGNFAIEHSKFIANMKKLAK